MIPEYKLLNENGVQFLCLADNTRIPCVITTKVVQLARNPVTVDAELLVDNRLHGDKYYATGSCVINKAGEITLRGQVLPGQEGVICGIRHDENRTPVAAIRVTAALADTVEKSINLNEYK